MSTVDRSWCMLGVMLLNNNYLNAEFFRINHTHVFLIQVDNLHGTICLIPYVYAYDLQCPSNSCCYETSRDGGDASSSNILGRRSIEVFCVVRQCQSH